MGNKPIEFEGFAQTASSDCKMKVMACGDGIDIHWNDFFVSVYRDPAKIDALADAIKRAADALRKSQQVTLGDLRVYDLFRFADEHQENVRVVTDSMDKSNAFVRMVERPEYSAWVNEITESKPVVRLTATFTPSPADAVSK